MPSSRKQGVSNVYDGAARTTSRTLPAAAADADVSVQVVLVVVLRGCLPSASAAASLSPSESLLKSQLDAKGQGLTLVHLSSQLEHLLWDELGGVSLTRIHNETGITG